MSGRLDIKWTKTEDRDSLQEWQAQHGDISLTAWAYLGHDTPEHWGGDWHGSATVPRPRLRSVEDAKAMAERQAYRLADDGLTADAAALVDELEQARAERDAAIQALRDLAAWCDAEADKRMGARASAENGAEVVYHDGAFVGFRSSASRIRETLHGLGVKP